MQKQTQTTHTITLSKQAKANNNTEEMKKIQQRILLSIVLCVGAIAGALAQDIHFSNFFTNSLNLNPAMAGYMKGRMRFNFTARDQYRTVAIPYKTFSLSADARLHQRNSPMPPFGLGVVINYDLAGDAQYGSTQIALPVAMHIPINQWTISPALMPAIGINSLDYTKLRFPDQFDGMQYDPNWNTSEILNNTRRTFFNMNAGIMATFSPSSLYSYTIGYAAYNMNRPNISWFNNDDTRLPMRSLIHGMAWLQLSANFDLVPQAKMQFQRKQQEFQFGAIGITYFHHSSFYKLLFGLFYRSKDRDAVVLTAGCNYSGFDIVFNYDINISQLRAASGGHGAMELSITHIVLDGRKRTKRAAVRCPGHI